MSIGGIDSSYSAIAVMQQMQGGQQAQHFQRVDSNSDGAIDKAEFSDMAVKMSEMSGEETDTEATFDEFDLDGNGILDVYEMEDGMKSLHEKMGPPPPPPGEGKMQAGGAGEKNQMESLMDALGFSSEDSEDENVFSVYTESYSQLSSESLLDITT